MKKIGIITMHRIRNYGSVLQAYALQRVIEKLGYDCFLIDYVFPNAFHNVKYGGKWTLSKIYRAVLNRVGMKLFYQNNKQNIRFRDFQTTRFHLTKLYANHTDLYENPPEFDLYVTGSDQVWNPKHMKGDSSFFCDFIKNGANRISYASSFSSKHLDEQYKNLYASFLNKYSAIGVREKSSIKIVREIAQKDAVWVCDPTLLLKREDYVKLATLSQIKLVQPYILVYVLGYNFNPHPMVDILVENEAKLRKLQIVYLQCNNLEGVLKKGMMVSSAGPYEFLWLFEHASFVITSSFHGTIFSLLFEKQFFSVSSKEDDRIASLLDKVHLSDRLVSNVSEISDKKDINYAVVSKNVDHFRSQSFDFLKESIDNALM